MKNKKIMVIITIFITVFTLFVINMNSVKAFEDDDDFIIEDNETNDISNENTNNEELNNEELNNEAASNNESNVQNNQEETKNNEQNNQDNSAENKLPQTGVAEDTTLFIFIGICLVSAIYAYMKIRRYRSI